MWRTLLAGLIVSFSLSALAEEPQDLAKKPQYERMLKGEDAKRAEELEKRIARGEAADDYAEAIKAVKELLKLRIRVQGADHYQTVNLKQYLLILRKVSALDAMQREGWRSAIGEETQAAQLEAKAKSAQGLSIRQNILNWRRDVLGDDHPHTAASYSNLAMNLNARGKTAEAEPFLQKSLEICRRVLGDEHPDTAMAYSTLATNLEAQAKYAEAGELHQQALHIFRFTFGEESLYTALGYNKLSANLHTRGMYAEAGSLVRKALGTRRHVLGDEHPSTAISYNNVAANLSAQGKHAEAEPLYRKAFDICRRVGEEHPHTATSYNNLAQNLDAQGKAAEAAPLYEKALDIRRRVLTDEHPDTASSYDGLGGYLNSQGKFAEAQLLYQRALDIRRRRLTEEHPDAAASCYHLAFNLFAQGKAAQAEPLLQKALAIRRRVLGEEHPHTADAYFGVAANLHAQGKAAEAELVLRRAVFSYEASRLMGAAGLERAALGTFNPRLFLAVLQMAREPAWAWDEVERSLARGLLDEHAGRHSVLTAEEQATQMRDQTRTAALQPQILALLTRAQRTDEENAKLEEILRVRREAEERLADLAVAVSVRSVATGDVIRTALPEDAALLLWVDVESEYGGIQEHFACAIRSSGDPHWEPLPASGPDRKWAKGDSKLPEKFCEALAGSASPDEIKSLAKQLHAQRIAPVLKHLSGVRTLYVVPANFMAGVPMEALTSDFTISYVPSGTFLARAKEKAPAAGNEMLAVGDPVFARRDATADGTRSVPATLPPNGLLITQVAAGGAAAKGRLQAGDVIVKYGETEITSMKTLDEAMEKNTGAKEVPVLVWRETEKEMFTRTVAPGKLGVGLAKEPAREAIANRRKTDTMLLALRRGGWKELPGTRVELTQIGKLFGEKTTTLVDSAASEETLEALRKKGDLTRFRYIHFATHGEGNQVKAFESALILSQDGLPPDPLPRPGEPFINGQLSAREVLDYWKLDAELVTLSACETAVGKQGGGDGLLGFAQAFLTAGARSVCLSLWKVDDSATALLMQRFYQNLLGKRPGLDKPMGKAAALDEAKRWLRELSSEEALKLSADMTGGVTRGTRGKGEDLKLVVPSVDAKSPAADQKKPFADPRYWAAFILIGDPN